MKAFSVFVFSKNDRQTKQRVTPFYQNVTQVRNTVVTFEERIEYIKYRIESAHKTFDAWFYGG